MKSSLARGDLRLLGAATLLGAMAVAGGLMLWLDRGSVFLADEWSWVYAAGGVVNPLAGSGGGWLAALFVPFNQHLMVVPLLIYRALLLISGTSFLPFRLVSVAAVLACGALVYLYARRRVGPVTALAPALVALFFGSAAGSLLQPLIALQMTLALPLGIGALLALDRDRRLADAVACLLLCLTISTYSSGLAFLAGAAIAIALGPRPRLRRAFVVAVPLVLYAAWRLWANQHVGTAGGPAAVNVPILPFYFLDSIAVVVTSMFGLGAIVGSGPATGIFLNGPHLSLIAPTVVFGVFELIGIALVARRIGRNGPLRPGFWTMLTTLTVLWTMQGLVLSDVRRPVEARYLYAGAVLLALVATEAASAMRLRRPAIALVLILAATGVVGNLPRFHEARSELAVEWTRAKAYTAALQLDAAGVDPAFVPSLAVPSVAPTTALELSAGAQLKFVHRYGSLGVSPAELPTQPAWVREGVDLVLVHALKLHLAPQSRPPAGRCTRAAPPEAGRGVALPPAGATLLSAAATPLELRRFGEPFIRLGALTAGRPARLRLVADADPQRWIVRTAAPVALRICALPRS